jgi:class 3 adenylate cyclase/TolB-like protein/tetratricopeptide (TPR) repeat protein
MTVPLAIKPVAERRLTAVLLADVVDYSRMMSRNEDSTHARIAVHARELIDPTIKKYGGRLVRSMGDGLLVEFVSALDAVRCAIDVQRGLVACQANELERIQLRIGINTGDVLVDQRDIYGNSVNIAARLEAMASPGTIYVSQSIYDQTRAQPEFFFADRGTHRVKNIPYPIRVYEVAHEPIRATLLTQLAAHWNSWVAAVSIAVIAIALLASALIFREQFQAVVRANTIVVLPFKNVNGNAADNYLADAITDDLTTELSRLGRAWVIASGTAFTYKDKPNDPRQIGRELNVRYALEGSVRRAGPMVQMNAQLIDTASGTNLWADSYTYETSSLTDLQDDIIGRIAGSLRYEVTQASARHEVGTLAGDHNPLDERMRAMAANTGYNTAEKSLETRQHAEAGLKADPDNARLLALLASVLAIDVLNDWNGAGQAEVNRSEAAAKKAIKLDRNYPLAHHALGLVHRIHGDHKAAFEAFNEAIKIDQNFARAYSQAANELVFLGKPEEAIPLAKRAAILSPKDPQIGMFLWVEGRAYFAHGDYPNAIKVLAESVRVRPNYWFTQAYLTAAYALVGRQPEAQKTLVPFTKNFPQYNLARITKHYKEEQYQNPTQEAATAQLLSGLRKAGLK